VSSGGTFCPSYSDSSKGSHCLYKPDVFISKDSVVWDVIKCGVTLNKKDQDVNTEFV